MIDLAGTMREIQKDCASDARRTEGMPLTGRNVGALFGSTLAMVASVARAVELLKAEVDGLQRVIDARTEHLA